MKKWGFKYVGLFILLLVGLIIYWPKTQQLTANIDRGASDKLAEFVLTELVNHVGGIKTTWLDEPYNQADPVTTGHAVLSESQGLLLEYARLTENKALFLTTFDFLTTYLQLPNGHYQWRISGNLDTNEPFTATIDDLQIVQQLILARKQWPELASELTPAIQAYADHFFSVGTNNGFIINGFNYETKQKTATLFLSYLDFSALETLQSELSLSEKIQLADLRKQSLAVVEQSYVSDDFPFYHQQFYVETLLLEQKPTINMIETMLVVKHLAEINQINETTIAWLEAHIEDAIYAYYDTTGTPVTTEQSSAVYALIAQTAAEIGNQKLYEQAIAKIWQYQIHDSEHALDGALGNSETQTVIAYDQLQTLIAVAKTQPIKEKNDEKTAQ
ncbi:MAG: hypothetical protein ACRCWD_01335 [Culicoidibacterales bacterium]